MVFLFDFPDRFTDAGSAADGMIDGIVWLTNDAVGESGKAVPAGSVLYVRGWAANVDGDGPATAVILLVDGVAKHHARVGVPRPDVARSRGSEAFAGAGFEAAVTTGRLNAGDHEISAYSVDEKRRRFKKVAESKTFSVSGDWTTIPSPTTAPRCSGSLDEVRDESRGLVLPSVDGIATVPRGAKIALRGWFFDPSFTPGDVDAYALIDGIRAYRAEYGSPRGDVVAKTGREDVGFTAEVPTAGLTFGMHTAELVARRRSDGSVVRTNATIQVNVGDTLPLRVALNETTAAFIDDIVRVQPNGPQRDFGAPLRIGVDDELFVRGWAVDEHGRGAAAGVVLVIDGKHEVMALYGIPRPDVAAARNDDGFLRTGFTAKIAAAGLDPGMHAVACYVVARDGSGAYRTGQQFDFEVSSR